MQLYISGIHTNVGKTHVSAAFCASFDYAYFKLIQAGMPRDCDIVAGFSPNITILGEGVLLQTPQSPHIGKAQENAQYKGLEIALPTQDCVAIELAGGLFSPLDESVCMIDYMSHFVRPTILVGSYYLGAINHILLSIEALRARGIPLLCLVMTGKPNPQIDSFIAQYSNVAILHLEHYNHTTFPQRAKAFGNALQTCGALSL